jgi:hypothetical protein
MNTHYESNGITLDYIVKLLVKGFSLNFGTCVIFWMKGLQ